MHTGELIKEQVLCLPAASANASPVTSVTAPQVVPRHGTCLIVSTYLQGRIRLVHRQTLTFCASLVEVHVKEGLAAVRVDNASEKNSGSSRDSGPGAPPLLN